MSAILGVPRIKNMRLLYHPEGSVSTSDAKFSKIFVFQGVNDIFLAHLGHGVHHGDKDDGEDSHYGDDDAGPGNEQIHIHSFAHGFIDQPADEEGDRQTEQQCLEPIEDTLKIDHPVEAGGGHADGFEHSELPAAEIDIGGDGIEDVGNRDKAYQGDKAVGKDVHNHDEAPALLQSSLDVENAA